MGPSPLLPPAPPEIELEICFFGLNFLAIYHTIFYFKKN